MPEALDEDRGVARLERQRELRGSWGCLPPRAVDVSGGTFDQWPHDALSGVLDSYHRECQQQCSGAIRHSAFSSGVTARKGTALAEHDSCTRHAAMTTSIKTISHAELAAASGGSYRYPRWGGMWAPAFAPPKAPERFIHGWGPPGGCCGRLLRPSYP
jgi:hypothetical protein